MQKAKYNKTSGTRLNTLWLRRACRHCEAAARTVVSWAAVPAELALRGWEAERFGMLRLGWLTWLGLLGCLGWLGWLSWLGWLTWLTWLGRPGAGWSGWANVQFCTK